MAAQPQPGPVHVKSFVEEVYDKFEDKRTTSFAWPASLNNVFGGNFKSHTEGEAITYTGFTFHMTLVHVKEPDVDGIILNYDYQGVDWGFVRDGKLIINIDGTTNIALEPVEANTETGFGFYNGVQEVGYYLITPEQLEAICNAQTIEIKITGGEFSYELANKTKQIIGGLTFPEKFLFMARGFYSGLYNDDSYLDHIKKVFEATAANDQARQKQDTNAKLGGAIIVIVVLVVIVALLYFFGGFHKVKG